MTTSPVTPPAPPRAPKRIHPAAKLGAAVLALLLVLFAVGKIWPGGFSGSFGGGAPPAPTAYPEAAPAFDESVAAAAEGGIAPPGYSPTAVLATDPSRDVIVSGSMSVAVPDPAAAADQITTTVASLDGRVDARSEYSWAADAPRSVSLTLRVPTDKIDVLITSIKALGETINLNMSAQDVTLETTDLQARITALQSSIDTLRTIQARAETVADLIAAEAEIGNRQMELDSLKAQLAVLADQVDLSTLSVDLSPTSQTPATGGFLDALQRGWNSLIATLTAGLYALGEAIPWLVFLTVLGLIVAGVVRFTVRRRRTAAPLVPAATVPATAPSAAASPAPEPASGASSKSENLESAQ